MSTSDTPVASALASEILARFMAEVELEVAAAPDLREQLHQIAEPSNDEHETARLLRAHLTTCPLSPLDGAGFFARIGTRAEPAVVIRAELDALPIVEATGATFASNNGYMHACGHDVHMAALAAVARASRRLEAQLPAPLVALFQPSEEAYPSGAQMVASQIDDLGPVGAVGAAHLHPDVTWKSVAADAGAVNAAVDNITIAVSGKAGHAAYPHQARDPVVALSQIVVNLQQIVSRRVDPTQSAAVTISTLQAGSTENVIPGVAEARGTIRTLDDGDRARVRQLVLDVAQHTALACGCEATVAVTEGEPAVVNDPLLAAHVRTALEDAGFGLASPLRSCGSDDIGFYAPLAPTMLVFVGLKGSPGGTAVPLHHPTFLPPADAVLAVAKAQAALYVGAAMALRSP